MNTQLAVDQFQRILSKPAAFSLKLLAIIAVLYTLYLSQTLLVPIFVAAFIALFCSPILRGLMVIKIPKPAGAILIIAALMSALGYACALLVEPATRWLQIVPYAMERMSSEMGDVTQPLQALRQAVSPESGGDKPIESAVDSTFQSVVSVMAETTAMFAIQVGIVVVITYFFLVFGDELMRNIVRAQRNFSDKKTTVVMFQAVQNDISRYVLVISLINVGLGLCTAGVMALLGVEDALLWGALATILNFAPYVGPMILAVILTGVGFIEFHALGDVLLVPGAFVLLNFIECQFVTPTLLGQRFNMNPLLVVLWMFAWGWLWGAVGMLIAIPLLVCFRILSTHLNLVGTWIKVLDGSQGAIAAHSDSDPDPAKAPSV